MSILLHFASLIITDHTKECIDVPVDAKEWKKKKTK